MWRKSAGSSSTELVDIIIIDWDCAHCIIEGRFHPKLWEALQNHQPSRGAEFGISFDNRYVNVLYREYDESERQYWIDLASGIKARIDTAFYALFSLMNTNSIWYFVKRYFLLPSYVNMLLEVSVYGSDFIF